MISSLELVLLTSDVAPLAVDTLLKACRALPFVDDEPDGSLRYGHPDTGVGFGIESDHSGAVPDGFHAARLRVRLELPRPRFFAQEAWETLAQLRTPSPLWMWSTDLEGFETPRRLDEALPALLEAYDARLLRVLGEEPRPDECWYWPRDQAQVWWEYARGKRALQVQWEDSGVFVPRVFLFLDRAGGPAVRTAIAWDDCCATVFPPCDWVLVLDRSAEPTASGQDTRLRDIALRNRVVEVLGDLVQVDAQRCAWPVLPADHLAQARRIFRQLASDPPGPLLGITPAKTIDVR